MKINWGWRVAIVYTLFALGTLGVVALAASREVDLVRPDYYEHTLTHEATAHALENGRRLGAEADVVVDDSAGLVVRIPSSHAPEARGTVTLYRPNSVKDDRTLPLHVDDRGVMNIPVNGMDHGRWRVFVEWTSDKTYRIERMIDVR